MEIKLTLRVDGDEVSVLKIDKVEEVKDEKREVIYCSQYSKIFDKSCTGWSPVSECNVVFLKLQQQYANDLLRARGHLFLNEVYDLLGMSRTKTGAVVGWIYDKTNPIGDNFVDFRLDEFLNKDFLDGKDDAILIDFNVDGYILDRLD